MKLITFVVPCYNSASYMHRCVESLLSAGEEAEIILIDDGSTKDQTPVICDAYAERYPNMIKVIHQENGGHGEGVNQGLQNASGLYYKVVDSDDWLNEEALKKMLQTIRNFLEHKDEQPIDMFLSNYVYEKVHHNIQKIMGYQNVFPIEQVFTWNDIRLFRPSQFIIMHTVIYRTQLLKQIQLSLPKHTFYVDNLFVYFPLPYVKKMYYMDLDLYRYFIGRDDQSVNEKIMIQRVDQQIRITKMIIDYPVNDFNLSPKLSRYMNKHLSMLMTICNILLMKANTEEAYEKKKELWSYLKKADLKLYKTLKYTRISTLTMLPSQFGRKVSLGIYHMLRKIYSFN